MIELRDVRFEYTPAGFSLFVPRLRIGERFGGGTKVAAIGPSGSGKTTLLNLVSGIERPATGEIETAGVRVDRLSPAARRSFRITHLGFVFQDFLLLEYLDVLQNILYPYRLHPDLDLNHEARARARRLAADLGIEPLLQRRPSELSQGERQRVALARALVTAPQLVLADEPTGNLDPATKEQVLELLFEQCDAHSMTLLMVTHDHALLDRFDQVIDVSDFARGTP
jgi:putative ABC transport system ATP-binding protein